MYWQGATAASTAVGTPAAPAWILMGGGRSQVQPFSARFFLESRAVYFSRLCALVPFARKRLSMRWFIVSTF